MSGACPISFSDIEAFCNLKGIYSLYERQKLLHFVDVLDRHWMTKHYEKQKDKMDGLNGRSSPKPRPSQPPQQSPRSRTRTRVS